MADSEVVVTLKQARETKNTVRFEEVEDPAGNPPAIGTLYVQKHIVRRLGNPETIQVTVSAAGAA